MDGRRFEATGFEHDLFHSGRQFSIQLCRLENHSCYCRNSEIVIDLMDINSDHSASARTDHLQGSNNGSSSKLKLKKYSCDQIGKFYDTTKELNLHNEIHNENKTEKSTVPEKRNIAPTSTKSVATAERLKSPGNSLMCPLCTKVVKGNRLHLDIHIRTHTKEKPFVCQMCNQGFVHSSNLSRHKRVHSGEKPYICQVCFKRFTQQENLKAHKKMHTGERPYVCTLCSQGFANKRTMELHEMGHTGERPYSCTICTKGFKEWSKLERHKKTHEGKK